MDRFNASDIQTLEVAERLKEDLKDFYQDRLIQSATFREKTSFANLLRAINHADRLICRDTHAEKFVVVYAPEGQTNIFLDNNDRYTSEVQDAIEALDIPDDDKTIFLSRMYGVYVIQINSRHLYIHKEYPTGAEISEDRRRKVGHDEFYGPVQRVRQTLTVRYTDRGRSWNDKEVESQVLFIPGENRLILGKAPEEPLFIRFQARVQPGILNLKDIPKSKISQCDYSIYKILSPHTAFEYLLSEALMWLLPRSAHDARQIVGRDRDREDFRYQKMKPTDSNVVVPDHSF